MKLYNPKTKVQVLIDYYKQPEPNYEVTIINSHFGKKEQVNQYGAKYNVARYQYKVSEHNINKIINKYKTEFGLQELSN